MTIATMKECVNILCPRERVCFVLLLYNNRTRNDEGTAGTPPSALVEGHRSQCRTRVNYLDGLHSPQAACICSIYYTGTYTHRMEFRQANIEKIPTVECLPEMPRNACRKSIQAMQRWKDAHLTNSPLIAPFSDSNTGTGPEIGPCAQFRVPSQSRFRESADLWCEKFHPSHGWME